VETPTQSWRWWWWWWRCSRMQAYVFLRSFSFSVLYLLRLVVDSFLIRSYGSWSKFKSAQASAASVVWFVFRV
jgi:hypothetical protein